MSEIVYLVACCGKKASQPEKAKDLYISSLFRKAKSIPVSMGMKWNILSALLGLVDPEDIVAPYDYTFRNMPLAMRTRWGCLVAHKLMGTYPSDTTYIFLAGGKYCNPVIDELRKCGHKGHIATPMKGLGIGKQLAKLNEWVGFGFGSHNFSE